MCALYFFYLIYIYIYIYIHFIYVVASFDFGRTVHSTTQEQLSDVLGGVLDEHASRQRGTIAHLQVQVAALTIEKVHYMHIIFFFNHIVGMVALSGMYIHNCYMGSVYAIIYCRV